MIFVKIAFIYLAVAGWLYFNPMVQIYYTCRAIADVFSAIGLEPWASILYSYPMPKELKKNDHE